MIFLPGTKLIGADRHADGMVLATERESIIARVVVNASGLYADEVSACSAARPSRSTRAAASTPNSRRPSAHWSTDWSIPCRIAGARTRRPPGADDGRAVRLGPTIRYQDRKDDYENDREPLEEFNRLGEVLPGVSLDDLRLSGSGIRAKLHPPSESFADFLIRRDRVNPALVHAAGIDSPGLTSCLDLASVGKLVREICAAGRIGDCR